MGGGNRYLYTALSAWIAVVIILSGGCSARDGNAVVAAPSASRSAAAGTETLPEPAGALQSNSEMEMVRLFHFLIFMDAAPAAALTRQQAEAMLPLVKKSVEKGTLGEDDKLAILALFRPEQQTMYADWSERKRSFSGYTDPAKGGHEEAADPENTHAANRNGKNHPAARDGDDRTGPGDWTAGEKNVEQQLIDLLESKTKE